MKKPSSLPEGTRMRLLAAAATRWKPILETFQTASPPATPPPVNSRWMLLTFGTPLLGRVLWTSVWRTLSMPLACRKTVTRFWGNLFHKLKFGSFSSRSPCAMTNPCQKDRSSHYLQPLRRNKSHRTMLVSWFRLERNPPLDASLQMLMVVVDEQFVKPRPYHVAHGTVTGPLAWGCAWVRV